MADIDDDDAGDVSFSSPVRTRWTVPQSIAFYSTFSTILTTSDINSITEITFLTQLKQQLLEHHDLLVDSKQIKARITTAKGYATTHAEQMETLGPVKARWERRRQQFLTDQNERRLERAARANRLRGSRPAPMDSDEEFDVDEPTVQSSPLQHAMLNAHNAYELVKERFENERKEQKTAEAQAGRESKNAMRLEQRRQYLMSTGFAAPDIDDADSTDSSASVPPPQRKFTQAAVVSVYTEYLAQQARIQHEMARELREVIKTEQDRTAEYRKKKLEDQEAYRNRKLAILEFNKETVILI
jgi:hypothetical protein